MLIAVIARLVSMLHCASCPYLLVGAVVFGDNITCFCSS